ncbi:WecB/TagA/CpsF family glycosyltransferase [Caldinitratiruptor microaerophilus]|uniref:N-acetylmannosaminyltransferase n=1 Tax=Caldinitratiruptor microaerophilus TaxID=671077 RepID=A0AA35CNF6_9FIRM|nr:WecB/TagA/CpsF family glycosyltransferase [Caldinitratiruptor microaerophilus]BDG61704.1 N-acetylmannosaminyltransferase [Caldinitratiruptor microaerophilus]
MKKASDRGRSVILGVAVDRVTLAEAVRRCLDFVASGAPHLVVTPNAEIVMAARRDPELRQVLRQADLVVPDGAGVVLAARLLGRPVPERVAGVDLAAGVLAGAPPGTRVFLLGSTPDTVAEAARRLQARYPNITVCGRRDGYWAHFEPQADREVVAAIRAARPHVLLTGMGAPLQEKWLARHLTELAVPLAMGIGGGIDLWAGKARRAPDWMIRLNLEWVYRIVRFGRYRRSLPPLIGFALRVLAERLGLGPGGGGGDAAQQEEPPWRKTTGN